MTPHREQLNFRNRVFPNIGFWVSFYFIMTFLRFYRPEILLADGTLGAAYYNMRILFGFPLILGFFIGSLNALMDRQYFSDLRTRQAVWMIVLRRTFYNLAIMIGTLMVSLVVVVYIFPTFAPALATFKWTPAFYLEFFLLSVYTLLGLTIFNTFKILRVKIGSQYFSDLVSGRYQEPKEENRVFLFLDLKSSTTLAETLGHEKYSMLIQDCFRDLTDPILDNHAELYQYVGDEVVLTWRIKNIASYKHAINIYFDFKDVLEEKGEYYKQNYGVIPEFKAGLNSGRVMVAEVGIIRKEIAYHSDVLNTAARIQELCNKFHQPFLVSDEIVKTIGTDNIEAEFQDNLTLRGKEKEVGVFAINQRVPMK